MRVLLASEAPTSVADVPQRDAWKRDLAPYLKIDRGRSLAQIASAVVPYIALWTIASAIQPQAWLAVTIGLAATIFLVRMYSLFHDLTHNSLFRSRTANARW